MYRFRLIRGRLGSCESELNPTDTSSIELFSRSKMNDYVLSAMKKKKKEARVGYAPDKVRLRFPSQSSSGQLRCSPISERNELVPVVGERYGPPILDRKLPEPDSPSGGVFNAAAALGPPGGISRGYTAALPATATGSRSR